MILGILAAAALVPATIAIAAPPAPTAEDAGGAAAASPAAQMAAAETETAAEQQDERKICRTEKATGSLTRRNRICLTQAQWRDVYDRTRRGVGELQDSGSGAPACISAMDAACGAPGPGGSVGM